jgi:hypothetical protein
MRPAVLSTAHHGIANFDHNKDVAITGVVTEIGRWEGDVLVVDTIGFTSGFIALASNLMYSEELHVEERFALDPETGYLSPFDQPLARPSSTPGRGRKPRACVVSAIARPLARAFTSPVL